MAYGRYRVNQDFMDDNGIYYQLDNSQKKSRRRFYSRIRSWR